jgi:rRNA maturation endonuclease Nob1
MILVAKKARVTNMAGEIEILVGGLTTTTKIGYVNRNRQRCTGHRGRPGNDHLQRAYKLECLDCGHAYGANGSDIFHRRCPSCQGGADGIPY